MKTSFSFFLMLIFLFPFFANAQEADTILISKENIYFDFAKDEIKISEYPKLENSSTTLSGLQAGFVELSAHTDSIGTNGNNYSLSERRANSVIQYLSNKGKINVPFKMRFDGENIPVAENNSDKGRSLNRRVELAIYKIKKKEIVQKQEKPKPKSKINKGSLEILVFDQETKKNIQNAEIHYEWQKTKQEKTTNETGEVRLDFNGVKRGQKINFSFYAKGYLHNSALINLIPNKTNSFKIGLQKAKVGTKLTLKNLYFYGNEARLLPNSVPELERLAYSLKMNPDAKVEIGGHINVPFTHPDDVPKWDRDLSFRRAEAVFNFLVENNIDKNRLTYKGYSNTQMKYPQARSQEHQAANRRVEIKVVE
ncbi:MAG: OmpA family protein [Saprospiraceae bacterium]